MKFLLILLALTSCKSECDGELKICKEVMISQTNELLQDYTDLLECQKMLRNNEAYHEQQWIKK